MAEAPLLEGYAVRQLSENTLEVDVESQQGLNSLFIELGAQQIAVRSMRNKSNRLEELFVSLVDKNLNQEDS